MEEPRQQGRSWKAGENTRNRAGLTRPSGYCKTSKTGTLLLYSVRIKLLTRVRVISDERLCANRWTDAAPAQCECFTGLSGA